MNCYSVFLTTVLSTLKASNFRVLIAFFLAIVPHFTNAQNSNPKIVSPPVTLVNEGDDYAYWISTSDADNDLVTVSGGSIPSWLNLIQVTDPVVTALAGRTFGFEDGTGIDAKFARPTDTAVDGKGNVYVADRNNQVIRKITQEGVVTTLAGSGTGGFQNGTGTEAQFLNPDLIAADPEGNVYVLDDSFMLRKIDVNGVVTTFSGGGYGFLDGAADKARFFNPQSMIVAPDRSLYFVDTNTIRKISPQGHVTTMAGTTTSGYADGTGFDAAFFGPVSIAMDSKGDLYVGDNGNLVIRKVTQAGVVTTFIGSGTSGNIDGTGAGASFTDFQSMAFDAEDNLYVAQFSQHNIRKVTPEGVVTAFAGSGTVGNSDGTGTEAGFVNPGGLSIDRAGNMYSAHFGAYKINKTTLPGMVLSGNSAGQAGQHPVSLNAADGNGGNGTQNFIVTVVPDGQTPINLIGATNDSNTQLTVTFDDNVQTNGGNPSDFIVLDGVGNSFTVISQADGTAGDTDVVLTVSDLSSAVGKIFVGYINNHNEISDAATGTIFASTNAGGISIDRSFVTTWSIDTDGGSITIPTVTGQTYDYTIDWGDGSVEANQMGDATHSYTTAGIKTVSISGIFPGILFKDSGEEEKLLTISQWGSSSWSVMENAFNGCVNLNITALDAPVFNGVTSLAYTFKNNTVLNADLDKWDVTGVTDMTGTFFNNSAFNGNISDWDVSSVEKMDSLFNGATVFDQNLNSWNIFKVTSMVGMFAGAEVYNQPMDNWSFFLTKNMSGMFAGASSFDQDISAWNVSRLENMTEMFEGATAFNQDISGWKVDFVRDMSSMFAEAGSFDQNLGSWNIVRVGNFTSMLDNSGLSLTNYDNILKGWSAMSVQSGLTLGATGVFYCDAETERESLITSKGWTINDAGELCDVRLRSATRRGPTTVWAVFDQNVKTNGTNPGDFSISDADGNFYTVTTQVDGTAGDATIELTVPDLAGVSGSLTLRYINNNNEVGAIGADIFADSNTNGVSLRSPFVTAWETTSANETIRIAAAGSGYNFDIDWGDGTVERLATDDVTHVYTAPGIHQVAITGSFPRINHLIHGESRAKLKSVEQWGEIFWDTMEHSFYLCTNMVVNATDAPNLSRITSTGSMFFQVANMNADISHWDVSNVERMDRMFLGASSFNQDISAWDVSSVTTMAGMFSGASAFNQNLNDWDVSLVTDMSSMFGGANAFNQPLDRWEVGEVTDMTFMFAGNDMFNSDISTWNTAKATSTRFMFRDALAFNQPIGDWDVSSVENMEGMFENAAVFNQNLNRWNPAKVTTVNLMFSNADAFNQPIGDWDVSSVEDFGSMFATTVFDQDIGLWNTGSATNMTSMFSNNRVFNQDIGDWDVSKVINMESMFGVATAFNQDISDWDVSNVDQLDMFGSALAFNQDLSKWDIRSATEISFSFSGLTSINYDKILKTWSALPGIKSNVLFGAADLKYCESATERDQLINTNSWSFDRDAEECAPRMLSASFDSNTQITLTFNEVVTTNEGNPGDFVITDALGNTFLVTAQSDGTAGDAGIILTVTDLSNATGDVVLSYNNNNDEVTGSTTIATESDPAGVVVDSDMNAPVIASAKTLTSTQVTLFFDESVQPNAGAASSFMVVDVNSTPYTVSAISDGTEKDNALILTLADFTFATGDLTITYINTSDEVADFGGNFLQSDATGVIISDKRAFITTWKTTVGGESITIPTTGSGYNYTIDWGDGAIETGQTGNAIHNYATAGTHEIKITGNFPRIFLNDEGDKDKLKSIEQWGVNKWSSMENAFAGAANLTYSATDKPDLSQVTSTSGMFKMATLFNGDIGAWDVSNVQDMSHMFEGAAAFNQDVSSWNISKVTYMASVFQSATSFNQDIGVWDVAEVTNMQGMFKGAAAFNRGFNDWNTAKVTDMSSMFAGATDFNGDISRWDVTAVTNMASMFEGASNFNQDLGRWDVTTVTDVRNMFASTDIFNQDLSQWKLMGITDLTGMFSDALAFNQDLSNWDVSNVTSMQAMFKGAVSFNQDLSGWNMISMTNASEMFSCAAVFNQNLEDWAGSFYNVTDVSGMFNGASSFDQNLSRWNTFRVTTFANYLDNSGMSPENLGALYTRFRFNSTKDVVFGAAGLYYCYPDAEISRQGLVSKGWIITDAGERCPVFMAAISKDTDTQVTVTFNQAVATNETNPTDFTITDMAGNTFTVSAQSDGAAGDTDVIFAVANMSTAVEEITVTYTNNNNEISGLTGLFMESDLIGITLDIEAPVMVGSQQAGTDRLYIYFSEKVATNETNPADFVITDSQNIIINVNEQLDVIAEDSVILLRVPDLINAIGDITISYVNNNDEVRDLAGNSLQTTTAGIGLSTDPQFISQPVITVNDGDTYTYKITVFDPNFDPTSVTATTIPSWLTVSSDLEVTTLVEGEINRNSYSSNTPNVLNDPNGLALNSLGELYVSDGRRDMVMKVAPDGSLSDFVRVTDARHIVFDSNDNLFVMSSDDFIYKVTPDGNSTLFAGRYIPFGEDPNMDGTGTEATFFAGAGMTIDKDDNIYLNTGAWGNGSYIRKMTPDAVVTSIIRNDRAYRDGPLATAQISGGFGMGVDNQGNIYVGDLDNAAIRKIGTDGIVSTLAGGTAFSSGDGTGTDAGFSGVAQMAVDEDDNLYVVDLGNGLIRKVTPAGVVTTFAGSGISGHKDGPVSEATFVRPIHLVRGAEGTFYLSEDADYDLDFTGIRKIGKVYTLTGDATGQPGMHDVVLEASDGNGGTVIQNFTINVIDGTAPVFTSLATVSVGENKTGTFYTATATDNAPVTFGLRAVNDEGLFNIDINTGELSFINAPDYENPQDGDANNQYLVEIIASDGTNSGSLSLVITVTDKADEIAPTVVLTAAGINPVGGVHSVTAKFSENITGFVIADLTITGGMASNFVMVDASTYTFDITSNVGIADVDINAAVALDAADNDNEAATQLNLIFDTTPPDVVLSSTANDPNSGAFSITITFTEDVVGFSAADLTIGNGVAGNLMGSGAVYTITITPAADGAVTVDLAAGTAQDLADNDNTAAAQLSITNDETAPTVAISSTASVLTIGAFDVAITFSETVTGFDVGGLMVSNGAAGNFTGSGPTYMATITPAADGIVTVDVNVGAGQDAAGNDNTAATQFSIENDETDPVVTITTMASDPTSGAFDVTFTFSEGVTGFAITDVSVGNGVASSFAGSGAVYTVTITPSAGGLVTLDVAAAAAQDVAGHDNTVATQLSIENDETSPTVVISSTANDPINVPFDITITFSEDVTGFDLSDLVFNTGTLSGFTGSGAVYTLTVTPGADGAITADIAAALTQDIAGNDNLAAPQFSIQADITAPIAPVISSISDDTGSDNTDGITNDNALNFTGTAEANSTVEVFLDGSSIGNASTDGSGNWAYDHSSTSLIDGSYSITATATDAATNESNSSSVFKVEVDTTTPVKPVIVSISDDTGISASDGITNDRRLIFSGTAEALSEVALQISGNTFKTTTADANGDWIADFSNRNFATGTRSITAFSTDLAGNVSPVSDLFTMTIDIVAPTLSSIARADANPTTASSVDFTVTFSEEVHGLSLSNFDLVFTDTQNANLVSVSATSGTRITVTVDNITGSGTFGLNLSDVTGITDLAGNVLGGLFTGEAYNTNFFPTDISLSASSILENNVIGDLVANLSTTDADAGDSHTYSLVTGTGDTDNASFTISSDQLQAAEVFDLETKASYDLRLKTDDGRGGTFEKAVTITIDNVPEADLRITGNNAIPATPLGITTTFDITIHNDGDAVLSVTSVLYPTAFGGPVSGIIVAPMSSQVVTLDFTPVLPQLYTGDITFITNGGTGILAVSADGAIITAVDNGQLKAEAINVYPNPASETVTIDLSYYNGRSLDIQLFNLSGTKTFSISDHRKATLTLDVSRYQNGLYLAQITDGKSTIQKKIMIRK